LPLLELIGDVLGDELGVHFGAGDFHGSGLPAPW
jgi:hypothetical protein